MTTRPRLYHVAVPGFIHSRTFRCIWLFEELGVDDFEICMLDPRKPYAPQMRDYGVEHSHKIPTLQMDGQEISDSGVISQLVAEKYQSARRLIGLPEERLEMLQWVAMAETCITFRVPLLPSLMTEGKSASELYSQAIVPMRQVFAGNVARFESHFEERKTDYLLASGFSVADTLGGSWTSARARLRGPSAIWNACEPGPGSRTQRSTPRPHLGCTVEVVSRRAS